MKTLSRRAGQSSRHHLTTHIGLVAGLNGLFGLFWLMAFKVQLVGDGFHWILMLPSIPIVGAVGLVARQGWARTLMIVVSWPLLLIGPVGTAIGGYGLWVLSSEESAQRFGQAQQPQSTDSAE